MAKAVFPPGLYALTDPVLLPEAVLAERVAEAIQGGAGIVQFRDKSADSGTLRRRGMAVLRTCRDHGAVCIINDDVALAAELEADGVHLGRHDADPARARAELGPERLIGVSCYDQLEYARAAVAAGADYVAFGSVWPSSSKPGTVRAPLALLRQAALELPLPIVAIGGITRDNAAETVAAGACSIAVIRALFADPDPRGAAQVLSAACLRGRAGLR
jgi:thiamine-phosphate pyrophosphorylase